MESPRKVYGTILATAALTAALVELWHWYYPSGAGRKLLKSEKIGQKTRKLHYSEELIREQLARNYAFLKEDGMEKVRSQRVVIVGCGGVGSWVATMLVRSGIGKIRLIDFDQVTLSSLNRHAVATTADVGTSKVDCLKNHLLEVAPWVEIEAVNHLWTLDRAEELIYGGEFDPTYVIDCIDNIDTKVDFLTYCYNQKLPVIASGGAALKSDPTRVNIADISMTQEDMLSRAVRIRLKKRGVIKGIPFVFSSEKPDPNKAHLLELDEQELAKGDVNQLASIQNFRVRILPVIGTMPGMFGLAIATYLLTTVAGYPTEPLSGKNRHKVYEGLYNTLSGQQSRLGHTEQIVPISLNDIAYLLEEIYRGKSPISNYCSRLTLSQWDPHKSISPQNIVVMTKEEQSNHEKRILLGKEKITDVYSKDVINLVNKRFAEEKFYSQFR